MILKNQLVGLFGIKATIPYFIFIFFCNRGIFDMILGAWQVVERWERTQINALASLARKPKNKNCEIC
jgi:hypothetical protein